MPPTTRKRDHTHATSPPTTRKRDHTHPTAPPTTRKRERTHATAPPTTWRRLRKGVMDSSATPKLDRKNIFRCMNAGGPKKPEYHGGMYDDASIGKIRTAENRNRRQGSLRRGCRGHDAHCKSCHRINGMSRQTPCRWSGVGSWSLPSIKPICAMRNKTRLHPERCTCTDGTR